MEALVDCMKMNLFHFVVKEFNTFIFCPQVAILSRKNTYPRTSRMTIPSTIGELVYGNLRKLNMNHARDSFQILYGALFWQ